MKDEEEKLNIKEIELKIQSGDSLTDEEMNLIWEIYLNGKR